MNKFLRRFVSNNRADRITNNLFFKYGMGCLSLIFILLCLGGMLLMNSWLTK
jgi:hypothetical protein